MDGKNQTLHSRRTMSKPIAVLISDVHYNLQTLPLADAAMGQAITKANTLNIPLIVAGDLHDTKANLRGECTKAMVKTFANISKKKLYILIGNHDKINEKSEEHALDFLEPWATLVDKPMVLSNTNPSNLVAMIPYQSDPTMAVTFAKQYGPNYKILIMHQGLQSSNSGDYIHDKSAISKSDVAGYRVISGHYHTRQTIALPDSGSWSYIGNPYSLSFGEASDPEKGFQILMDDGSLEFIPTNLRKHVIYNITNSITVSSSGGSIPVFVPTHTDQDLIWVKVTGSKEFLPTVTKKSIQESYRIAQDFRLDLIPTDTQTTAPVKPKNNADLMDSLIDSLTETSDDRKIRLKELWRRMGGN
jgi:DNA repair exonuclease SbcCD nuclease subunit